LFKRSITNKLTGLSFKCWEKSLIHVVILSSPLLSLNWLCKTVAQPTTSQTLYTYLECTSVSRPFLGRSVGGGAAIACVSTQCWPPRLRLAPLPPPCPMERQSRGFAAGAWAALRGELGGAERAARAVGGKGRLIFL